MQLNFNVCQFLTCLSLSVPSCSLTLNFKQLALIKIIWLWWSLAYIITCVNAQATLFDSTKISKITSNFQSFISNIIPYVHMSKILCFFICFSGKRLKFHRKEEFLVSFICFVHIFSHVTLLTTTYAISLSTFILSRCT